jgi:hypothetical protein
LWSLTCTNERSDIALDTASSTISDEGFSARKTKYLCTPL